MKTEHLSGLVIILVILTAVIGLYYMYEGTGRAVEIPKVDTIGTCLCRSNGMEFLKPAEVTASDSRLEANCMNICSEFR